VEISYAEAISRTMQVMCMLADKNGGTLEVTDEEMNIWSEKLGGDESCMSITHTPGGPWVFKSVHGGRAGFLREMADMIERDQKHAMEKGVDPPTRPSEPSEEDKEVIRAMGIKPWW
jgi:hypothetical protein